ncbi:hypothetical protein [Microcoleus vaginatus]|uniref:hypothetical protein n=1 Tax=Microcoleus vaginatus TaxID=119532 RepID=UPI00403F12D4
MSKKNPGQNWLGFINQGASTNLISRLKTPLSGHFGRICENWRRRRAIGKKKPQTKIGRELINQGASTNLVSGFTPPLSGHFGRLCGNLWRRRARSKKKPGQNWSGVN